VRADALTRAALGLAAPATEEQSRARAYHAPTRAMLVRAGVDLAHVSRVWDFTTRSREQPTRVLAAIAKQMPADGVLYLGGAETVLGITDVFASAPGERGVYELAPAPTKRPIVAATR
jgi:hypothetical protein